MKLILGYLKPFKKRISIGLTVKVLGTLVELFIPYILTHILQNVVGSGSVKRILLWGALMLLCAAAACILNITANRMAAFTTKEFSREMRKRLFERTISLSARQTDGFTIPSLESRITTDTYNVHNFIGMMQRMGVRAPILLIGGVAVTLIMDASLAVVMLALLPFIFITVYCISIKGVPLYTRVQKSQDAMVRVVREDAQGIRVIKALSKNKYENARYDEVNSSLSFDERHAGIIMGIVNPVMTLLMNLGITSVVALAAVRVGRLESSAETVIAFIQYFTLISMAMMSLSRIFVMYTKCAASAKRISEVIESPEDLTVDDDGSEYDPSSAHISFENVTFSYNGKHNHLEEISFSVEKGGRLGIIGATGSGKSTVIRLLMRFYDVNRGHVKIFGKDVRTIPKKELKQKFGVALQNDFLYTDSISENISFGRALSELEIKEAAKIAQANDFIEAFPEGYGHLLTQKGTNISGGQKQRILIARAIAAKPEILILDDSSSALDYKTDASLREALKRSLGDTTVITVAQRVSSVKDSNLILVIDEGRIIGSGTHEELLSSCKEYKEISDSQMGGAFIE